ncbi:TRL-like family protein [Hahella sp. SMD15-11]|uniref:TRL-like family protein n=1 Tax=Thermohahella caldifontis TaxID=3142973 RepID=A0AB39UUG7_9GAMM
MSASLLSGCATNMFPGGLTPAGVVFTNVKSPAQHLALATDAQANPMKVGKASASAVLGLFATGDNSISAAMKNGAINRVHHVDHEVNSFLFGLWLQDTTYVYGE